MTSTDYSPGVTIRADLLSEILETLRHSEATEGTRLETSMLRVELDANGMTLHRPPAYHHESSMSWRIPADKPTPKRPNAPSGTPTKFLLWQEELQLLAEMVRPDTSGRTEQYPLMFYTVPVNPKIADGRIKLIVVHESDCRDRLERVELATTPTHDTNTPRNPDGGNIDYTPAVRIPAAARMIRAVLAAGRLSGTLYRRNEVEVAFSPDPQGYGRVHVRGRDIGTEVTGSCLGTYDVGLTRDVLPEAWNGTGRWMELPIQTVEQMTILQKYVELDGLPRVGIGLTPTSLDLREFGDYAQDPGEDNVWTRASWISVPRWREERSPDLVETPRAAPARIRIGQVARAARISRAVRATDSQPGPAWLTIRPTTGVIESGAVRNGPTQYYNKRITVKNGDDAADDLTVTSEEIIRLIGFLTDVGVAGDETVNCLTTRSSLRLDVGWASAKWQAGSQSPA